MMMRKEEDKKDDFDNDVRYGHNNDQIKSTCICHVHRIPPGVKSTVKRASSSSTTQSSISKVKNSVWMCVFVCVWDCVCA